MLRLQVVPARRRGRPRPLLHVRAARLRGAGGLDAAVPRPRPHRPRGRADQLRRGGPDQRHPAPERDVQGDGGRGAHARHPPARARAGRAGRARVPPGPVRRHLDPGRRRQPPLVLDGQPAVGQGPAGVHDQALPRRALLGPARLRQICEGTELEIQGPYGVFTLREQSPRRLLFIGGGAGMAPILCLLRSLAERGVERAAVYYYGARTEADLFHRDELEALAARAAVVPLRARAVRGRVGGRDRPDHRRRRALRGGLRRRRRLRVRSAADGRGRPRAC